VHKFRGQVSESGSFGFRHAIRRRRLTRVNRAAHEICTNEDRTRICSRRENGEGYNNIAPRRSGVYESRFFPSYFRPRQSDQIRSWTYDDPVRSAIPIDRHPVRDVTRLKSIFPRYVTLSHCAFRDASRPMHSTSRRHSKYIRAVFAGCNNLVYRSILDLYSRLTMGMWNENRKLYV